MSPTKRITMAPPHGLRKVTFSEHGNRLVRSCGSMADVRISPLSFFPLIISYTDSWNRKECPLVCVTISFYCFRWIHPLPQLISHQGYNGRVSDWIGNPCLFLL